MVVSHNARSAPWPIGEARYFRRERPGEPIVPIAFGDGNGPVDWARIQRDLFESEVPHVELVPDWQVGLHARVLSLWDRLRRRPGPRRKPPAREEYLGIEDSRDHLLASTPGPAVIDRIADAQGRLHVSTVARRAGFAALGVALALGLSVTALTVRYYVHLPVERLDRARNALVDLGFKVEDDDRTNYRIFWDNNEQGAGASGPWARARPLLESLDHYASISTISLGYVDVTDLEPVRPLRSPRMLKVMGCPVKDLEPVERLKGLTDLVVNTRLVDDDELAHLRGLTRLETLDLSFCKLLTNRGTRFLAGLPIRDLALTGCKGVDNGALDSLAGMPLERLVIGGTGVRVDRQFFEFAKGFPHLKTLALDGLATEDDALRDLEAWANSRGVVVTPHRKKPGARSGYPSTSAPRGKKLQPPPP